LLAFISRLQAGVYEWFRFVLPTPFGYIHVGLFVVQ
jgi:hypothetical protein